MLLPSGSQLNQLCWLAMASAWTFFLTPGVKSQTPIPGWESGNRNGCLQAAALGLAHRTLSWLCACVNLSWVFKSVHGSPTSTQPLQPPTSLKSRLGTSNNHRLPNPNLPFPRIICRAEEPLPAFCLKEKSERRQKSITSRGGFACVGL